MADKQPPVIIYNLFPKLIGAFSKWKPHLERAAEMNFNWIFINPIQLSGFSGSMYAIKDYVQIDPQYIDAGSPDTPDAQFRKVVEQAHALGLKMMMDLVINHTSFDSELTQSHPQWFKRDARGNLINPGAADTGTVWGDLVEIDNENSPDRENLWHYWENLVAHYLSLGIDGFRCDAAYQVPTPLWKILIQKAKSANPDVKFFAESLGCPFPKVIELANAGFDYTFNSSKWWDFRADWAPEQYEQNRLQGALSVSFAESHDTPRLATELDGNLAFIKMRYLFSCIYSTGVMMPVGFEFCFRNKPDVVKTTPALWEEPHCDLQEFIRKANQLKYDYPIFAEESRMEILPSGNLSVLILRKTSNNGRQSALILLNHDPKQIQEVVVPDVSKWLPGKIQNISVENREKFDPHQTNYKLKPGQIIILLGEK